MSVVSEIQSAVFILVVIHMAAFVMMVGYRMHTLEYYKGEAVLARELALQQEEQARTFANSNEKTTNATNPLKPYEASVQLFVKDVDEASKQLLDQTEALNKHSDELSTLEQTVTELMKSTSRIQYNRPKTNAASSSDLKDLLQTKSLREIPSEKLEQIFASAKTEILAILETEDANQRYQLAQQFRTTVAQAVEKQPRSFTCPKVLPNNNNDDEVILSNRVMDAAYESDLEVYVEKFESKFANRIQARGISALLPTTLEQAEDIVEEQIELILEDIVQFADSLEDRQVESTSTSSCDMDQELVTALVSAGLDAQVAHGDVQEALRKSILQYDASLSIDDLILDADLGGSGTCSGPTAPKIINLRSKLDTPLLIKSMDWIDAVVDAVGGYNDALDQYLDSLTVQYATTSIGEILVEGILEQAGKAGDIEIEKYVNEAKEMIYSITGQRL